MNDCLFLFLNVLMMITLVQGDFILHDERLKGLKEIIKNQAKWQ